MASDHIPFDRSLDAKPDHAVQVSPLVRRIIANNGGPFTFTGTCTYLVGHKDVTIIDPGPATSIHHDAVVAAIGDAHVAQILVTHSHRDHAPGAATLKAATGAPVLGCAPYRPPGSATSPTSQMMDAAHDGHYAPDMVLSEGAVVEGPDYRLVAVATPGHTSNHLAFALQPENSLFSGDHVMAWSTTVVAPPDGSMRSYMESLEKLQSSNESVYWPGHGGPVKNPQRFVRALALHRRQREHAILKRLQAGDRSVDTIVKAIYDGLAPALRGAAALSVLAHLIDLIERGIVRSEGEAGVGTSFRPAD